MPHPRVRKYELYPHPSQKWLGEEASRGGGDQVLARADLGDGRSTAGGRGRGGGGGRREKLDQMERNYPTRQPYPDLKYVVTTQAG
jgi:hypothetical protein